MRNGVFFQLGVPWRNEPSRFQSNGLCVIEKNIRNSPKNSFSASQTQPLLCNSHSSRSLNASQNYNQVAETHEAHFDTGSPESPELIQRHKRQVSSNSIGHNLDPNDANVVGSHHQFSQHSAGIPLSRQHSFTNTPSSEFRSPGIAPQSPVMDSKPMFEAIYKQNPSVIHENSPSYFQQVPRQKNPRRRRGKHVPKTRSIDVSRIDLYSRIMFPLTYIMICLVYWMVYLGVTNLQDKTATKGGSTVQNSAE